jgi:hypothetical protein
MVEYTWKLSYGTGRFATVEYHYRPLNVTRRTAILMKLGVADKFTLEKVENDTVRERQAGTGPDSSPRGRKGQAGKAAEVDQVEVV